jgi:hypothetical protein
MAAIVILFSTLSSTRAAGSIEWDEYGAALPDEFVCVLSRVGTLEIGGGNERVYYQLSNRCSRPLEIHCAFAANGHKLPAFEGMITSVAQTTAEAHAVNIRDSRRIAISVASERCEFWFSGSLPQKPDT